MRQVLLYPKISNEPNIGQTSRVSIRTRQILDLLSLKFQFGRRIRELFLTPSYVVNKSRSNPVGGEVTGYDKKKVQCFKAAKCILLTPKSSKKTSFLPRYLFEGISTGTQAILIQYCLRHPVCYLKFSRTSSSPAGSIDVFGPKYVMSEITVFRQTI